MQKGSVAYYEAEIILQGHFLTYLKWLFAKQLGFLSWLESLG